MEQGKRTAYDRLGELLSQSEAATYAWVENGTHTEWQRNVQAALRRLFGDGSDHLKTFKDVHYSPMVFTNVTPDSVWVDSFQSGMRRAQALVRAAIKEVEDYELPAESSPTGLVADAARQVFVVHGQDAEMKEAIARFLERLGLDAVILGERPSAGDTVIEKFERRSSVAFAVILLSPDDLGAKASEENNLRHRARQNVILELGYFLGSLGRPRVCPIVRGHIELPSDLHGLVYVPFDGDSWKIQLVKELKEAGLEVDANRAF